ncbi:MAG TPA: trigger factor [Actinomycetota bacterium]|nr:trigger factor [Actinomycetota bacterium]
MPAPTLQTTSERVSKDRVKLRVEVPEEALRPAIAAAYRRWAAEIKVPGFRKGKVPRPIIDSRVGADVVREEALRDAMPELYREALERAEIEAIAPPDINVVEFAQGAPLVFEATVDVRPDVVLPDLSSIAIDAPPAEVTDDDVAEHVERLRDRFAELETVAREARRGDHVLIDLKGYRGDELVEGASAPDFLYEVGSRRGPARLDEELEGSRPGAILKFTERLGDEAGELAGQDISFTVLVKDVKAKKLPAIDDDFARTVGEFETIDELEDDLRTRLRDVKRAAVEEEIRARALEALVDRSGLDAPERLVDDELRHRMEHLEADLRRAGMTLAQYAERTDSTELELRAELRKSVARTVVAELLLEQVAREQDVQVTDEDLGREVALVAARTGRDAEEVTKELLSTGRLRAVAADIMRRKALDYVVAHVNVKGRSEAEDGPGGGVVESKGEQARA